LFGNPEPFCFENADVTNDGKINILDVVATINIVLGTKSAAIPGLISSAAHIFLTQNSIELISDGTLAGLQFEIDGAAANWLNFELQGYEFMSVVKNNKLTGMIFSFDNKPIPAGKITLFSFTAPDNELRWGDVIAANRNAIEVDMFKHQSFGSNPETRELDVLIYPNPSQGSFTVEISQQASCCVTDVTGREILIYEEIAGTHTLDLSGFGKGVYFLKVNSLHQVITNKLIVN
jgi:hypothetical protein